MLMRHLLIALALLIFSVPLSTSAAYIESFDAAIRVSEDSSFEVMETIEYVSTKLPFHFVRSIPLTHPDPSRHIYTERTFTLEVNAVRRDDVDVAYHTEKHDGVFDIIIDDEGGATSTVKYVITYTVRGGISYSQYGGAELHWNVTGGTLDVPIRVATARVSSSEPFFRGERSCYHILGALSTSCEPVVEDGDTIIFTATNIDPRRNLFITQAVDRSRIQHVVIEHIKPLWLTGVLGIILLVLLSGRLYQYIGTRFGYLSNGDVSFSGAESEVSDVGEGK